MTKEKRKKKKDQPLVVHSVPWPVHGRPPCWSTKHQSNISKLKKHHRHKKISANKRSTKSHQHTHPQTNLATSSHDLHAKEDHHISHNTQRYTDPITRTTRPIREPIPQRNLCREWVGHQNDTFFFRKSLAWNFFESKVSNLKNDI